MSISAAQRSALQHAVTLCDIRWQTLRFTAFASLPQHPWALGGRGRHYTTLLLDRGLVANEFFLAKVRPGQARPGLAA